MTAAGTSEGRASDSLAATRNRDFRCSLSFRFEDELRLWEIGSAPRAGRYRRVCRDDRYGAKTKVSCDVEATPEGRSLGRRQASVTGRHYASR